LPGAKVFHVPPPAVEASAISPLSGWVGAAAGAVSGEAAGDAAALAGAGVVGATDAGVGSNAATAIGEGDAPGFGEVPGAGEPFAFFASLPPFGVGDAFATTTGLGLGVAAGCGTAIAGSMRTSSLVGTAGVGVAFKPGNGIPATAGAFRSRNVANRSSTLRRCISLNNGQPALMLRSNGRLEAERAAALRHV
jgi:hypothetical protein